jgi:molybdopterin converting factor small subunit
MQVWLRCGSAREALRLDEDPPPTVSRALAAARRDRPRLFSAWLDETGRLRDSLSLFVNGENVRYRGGLEAALADGDELTVIPLIAGG